MLLVGLNRTRQPRPLGWADDTGCRQGVNARERDSHLYSHTGLMQVTMLFLVLLRQAYLHHLSQY